MKIVSGTTDQSVYQEKVLEIVVYETRLTKTIIMPNKQVRNNKKNN